MCANAQKRGAVLERSTIMAQQNKVEEVRDTEFQAQKNQLSLASCFLIVAAPILQLVQMGRLELPRPCEH